MSRSGDETTRRKYVCKSSVTGRHIETRSKGLTNDTRKRTKRRYERTTKDIDKFTKNGDSNA